ncbi:MAG: tetratricopeptide repeat protein [Nitrospira sp.]
MSLRYRLVGGGWLVMMALFVSGALADDTSVSLARQSLEECERGRAATDRATRLAHFEQGRLLGEQAVEKNELSADAHFSLFCNLGELLRIDGETLTSLFGFRRMMKELDRALELDPDHIDALSAKGTLLVKLPGLLGGDSKKGEQILEQVVRRAPKAVNARLALAKVRHEQGRHQEAMTLASDALAIAQQYKRTTFVSEAKAILQQLRRSGTASATASYTPRF